MVSERDLSPLVVGSPTMAPWRQLLDTAIEIMGQTEVAKRLGVSVPTVSMVTRGVYPASTANIEIKVNQTFGGKMEEIIPKGYKKNAVGHLVPIESIKEADLARDELVREIMVEADKVSRAMIDFKERMSGDIQAFLELAAEKYGAKIGGVKGNVILTSFDGRYQIMRAVSDRIEFDEKLLAAKALIDDCLREWTKDSGSELRALIGNAFQVDSKGKINTKRILGLQKIKIDHERWEMAMQAIRDAVTVVGSCTYFRIYERDAKGKYQQIAMDFSAA